ncbi:MAG: hypothetical protein LQ342_001316 [Letrouitia transgressa]|nr:MAG: hypothetical protein LQ342_001316 [Letrouitia transgressa]
MNQSILIVDPLTGQVIASLPALNVFELGFSPQGTFIVTWQRPSREENREPVKNLKVWRVLPSNDSESVDEKHDVIGHFVQKSQTGWNLQYTFDEQFCARLVSNEVQIYKSDDLRAACNRLRVDGVVDFALSPGQNHAIAVFVPERKGQPAAVKIFNSLDSDVPVSQKTFFKGDKVQLKWNQEGTSLIVLAQTEVDKSGKSYYGETTLYLLTVDGQFESRIDLDKDGPIHDVSWSPSSKEFGVVYGYMPAKTTVFNTRAAAVHSFALSPRNTIIFSPQGRFVVVAGFGNLAGQMDIYDLEKNYRKICTIEASNASVCEWSHDGKHIMTATTSPRLRVDNGVRIWHVSGKLMYNEDIQELYHVIWRPQNLASDLSEPEIGSAPSPHESALAYLGTVKTPSKPAGAYRPPGARGQVTPIAFRREDEGGAAYVSKGNSSIGTAANIFGKSRRRDVPGAEPASEGEEAAGGAVALANDETLSKAALKNKKKREAKKAKETSDRATNFLSATNGTTINGSPSPSRSPERGYRKEHLSSSSKGQSPGHRNFRQGSKDPPKTNEPHLSNHHSIFTEANGVKASPASSEPPPDFTVTSPGNGANTQDKKVRALLKKLRAIDDLKMRRAGGEKLEGTQIKKMNTEEDIREELKTLGWND